MFKTELAPEVQAFAARVAYHMGCTRSDFSDEEMLFIETARECHEAPADTAYFLESARNCPIIVVEDEE